MKKLISVLTVLALCLCLLPVSALAADTVTLNIADGAIVISATGYSIDGGAETAFTGSYIITGSANTTGPFKTVTVNGVASGSEVTLKDLSVVTSGPPALTLNVPVKATGKLTVGAAGNAVGGSGINITGDADISAKMTGGAPVFSAGTVNITCRSMDIDAGMAFSSSSVTVNASGNIKLKTSSPCISASGISVKAGGNIDMESTNLCISGTNASVEAGGNITMVSTGVPTIYTGKSVNLKAGGNLTLQGDTSNVVNTTDATLSASGNITVSTGGSPSAILANNHLSMTTTAGDITVTNTAGIAVDVDTCDISAGGKLTIQGAGTAPAFLGKSDLAQKLQAKGDVTVSSSSAMGMSAGNVTVSGANVTVQGGGTAPAIATSSFQITATGDVNLASTGGMALSSNGNVTVSGANVTVRGASTSPAISADALNLSATGNVDIASSGIAASANKDSQITADGNIKISAKGRPALSSGSGTTTVKAKGTVDLTAESGLAASGKSVIEGSNITVTAGAGAPAFQGETSLKATTGNLNVTSTATDIPLFYDAATLYAAEEINLKTDSNQISDEVPVMTFGKHFNAVGKDTSLFIGLNRVAVADGTNYLPLLQMKVDGQQVKEAVFTAKSGDKAVTAIKDAGTYACGVSDSANAAGVAVIPFNLLVRKAKPAVTPSTGDNTQLGLLMVLSLASAASLAGVYFSRKRFTR